MIKRLINRCLNQRLAIFHRKNKMVMYLICTMVSFMNHASKNNLKTVGFQPFPLRIILVARPRGIPS